MDNIIIGGFFFGALAIVIGGGFFLWLNSRDSSAENKAYGKEFSPGDLVAKYRFTGHSPEDQTDPYQELKRFAQQAAPKAAKIPAMTEEIPLTPATNESAAAVDSPEEVPENPEQPKIDPEE